MIHRSGRTVFSLSSPVPSWIKEHVYWTSGSADLGTLIILDQTKGTTTASELGRVANRNAAVKKEK